MTRLLEKAIDQVRDLPAAEQDAMAMLILDAIEAGAQRRWMPKRLRRWKRV